MERHTTLEELEACWSLDDLERANALLDMRQELQQREMKRVEARRRKR